LRYRKLRSRLPHAATASDSQEDRQVSQLQNAANPMIVPITSRIHTTLMGLLILRYAGSNVSISSGRASSPHGFAGCDEITRHIFVDGALTDDREVRWSGSIA
jgi:hypothetical protein